jgi:hypothetical protein
MTPALVEHLERFLGGVLDGWKSIDSKARPLFDVVRYAGPFEGCVAFSTLGLSNYVLNSRVSAKKVRCELLMITRDSGAWIPSLLDQIGAEFVSLGFAPLRGDVIGPRGKIGGEYEMTALYSSIPIYLPEQFASCELPSGEQVIFIWLIPLYEREAELINNRGWKFFEQELEKQDPDLLDMRRPPMIAG